MLRRVHADRRRLSRILIDIVPRKTPNPPVDSAAIEPFPYYGA